MRRCASLRQVGTRALACVALASACAPSGVVTRADSIAQVVRSATQRGALTCAPQELALAKVNLEFARLELSQGDRERADHHLTLAEPNAKAALRVASDGKCKGSSPQPARAAGAGDGVP
jgi:OOP family OmpA-OmpF porin